MRKTLAGTAVVVLMVGASAWGGDANKDKQAMQGTWTLKQVQLKGKTIPIPADKEMKMVINGEKVIMKGGFKGDDEGTFKLDSSKTPKQITLTKKGGGADDTMNGIYEVKGDTLRLAYSLMGPKGPRPKGFDDEEAAVMTLKKAK